MKSILTRIIAKLMVINYRLCLAKWMLRLGRFHKATDPGVWIAFVGGGILLTMVSTFSDVNTPMTIPFTVATVKFFKFGFLSMAALYGIWEIIQGVKWIHQWSERYVRGY